MIEDLLRRIPAEILAMRDRYNLVLLACAIPNIIETAVEVMIELVKAKKTEKLHEWLAEYCLDPNSDVYRKALDWARQYGVGTDTDVFYEKLSELCLRDEVILKVLDLHAHELDVDKALSKIEGTRVGQFFQGLLQRVVSEFARLLPQLKVYSADTLRELIHALVEELPNSELKENIRKRIQDFETRYPRLYNKILEWLLDFALFRARQVGKRGEHSLLRML